VYSEVEREKELLHKVLAVAARNESLGFADLFRPGDNMREHIERLKRNEDPGVKFTTSTRTVVIEFHSGQLRYYAGGWPSSQANLHSERIRVLAEGCELGSFRTIQDSLRFTEKYLAALEGLQDITVPREVLSRRETTTEKV
jgi:hypothetical protein